MSLDTFTLTAIITTLDLFDETNPAIEAQLEALSEFLDGEKRVSERKDDSIDDETILEVIAFLREQKSRAATMIADNLQALFEV